MKRASKNPWEGSPEKATKEVEKVLSSAVCRQMVADVPVGTFLSGGIDSSLISALAQQHSATTINTYSIGFSEQAFNEAAYAKQVSRHLGTNHSEVYVGASDALNVIPRLPQIFDEPFADSSQIPTHIVSCLARSDVTVSLSGDGGDEIFGGYNRYQFANNLWQKINKIPTPLRKILKSLILSQKPDSWERIGALTLQASKHADFGTKMHKAANVLDAADINSMYSGLVSTWQDPSYFLNFEASQHISASMELLEAQEIGTVGYMMYHDTIGYLPDDILVKVDRASMSTSLEARVPFLDPKVIGLCLEVAVGLQDQKWPRKMDTEASPKKTYSRKSHRTTQNGLCNAFGCLASRTT